MDTIALLQYLAAALLSTVLFTYLIPALLVG